MTFGDFWFRKEINQDSRKVKVIKKIYQNSSKELFQLKVSYFHISPAYRNDSAYSKIIINVCRRKLSCSHSKSSKLVVEKQAAEKFSNCHP